MIGYVKCPKCHAPMPGATTARARRASMAGGTTSERIEVEPVATAGGGGLWWIAALVVAGAGLALWATQCRGSARRTDTAAAVVDQPSADVGATAVDVPTTDVRPPPVAAGNPDPAFAADALEGELAAERLFATVDVAGDLLDVRSAFCNEAALGEIIARHAAELRGAGVVRVRCSETYGTQVFERGL